MARPLARAVATFGFIGHLPLAPGTWASAATLLLWWRLPSGGLVAAVVLWVLLLIGGTVAAHRAEAVYGHDDRRVVIDEVAGSLLAVAGFAPSLPVALAGFALFRLFDIVKPPPVYQLQALPGGLGVMVDDLAAGFLANVTLRGILFLLPGITGGAA